MICRLLFFRFCVFVWPLCFLYVDLRPLITPFVSLRFSLNNTVLPAICDGWHFIHMWKALHGLIISLKGEVRAGIYSIVFGYIYFIEVKWLEHWTISTDNIWKFCRLELKDILIQFISISDDIRVNSYTNCVTNGAGSTEYLSSLRLFMWCVFLNHRCSVHLRTNL